MGLPEHWLVQHSELTMQLSPTARHGGGGAASVGGDGGGGEGDGGGGDTDGSSTVGDGGGGLLPSSRLLHTQPSLSQHLSGWSSMPASQRPSPQKPVSMLHTPGHFSGSHWVVASPQQKRPRWGPSRLPGQSADLVQSSP